ncbi:MAG: peptide-binding protein [Deltaproteobacteria bacterium]|jgi:peptide/nickel transport system substrate-binding protein|nr:peptide-binding protein [Deltaproteobacteria bacterium]
MFISGFRLLNFSFAILIVFLALSSPLAAQRGPVGDSLIWPSIADATNLIPALASDTSSTAVTGYIYRGLVKYDKNLNLVGDLAESWEISPDKLSITFHLKKNILWQDGTPFTSADCLFTWQLMKDPMTPTPYGEDFTQISEAETPDPHTFKVTYKRTLASALTTWSFNIMPKHLMEGVNLDESPLARNPVGNGPFKLQSWDVGQRIVLTASDSIETGRPPLNSLVIRYIPDVATQMMELRVGNLDMMTLTPDQWEQANKNPKITQDYNFFKSLSFSYTYLGFNMKDSRLSDKLVRQAIAYAINKDSILNGVLSGYGELANGPFRPQMWAYNKNIKPYPYDPEKAKALLTEAGWVDTDRDGYVDKDGNRFVLTILFNQGNNTRESTGIVIQDNLKDVGIEVKLRVVEWASLTKEFLDKHNFEAVIMGWTIPLNPDLYDVFNSKKVNHGELNFISYANPEVDELIDVGRFNLEQNVRKKAFDRIQEIFYEDVPYVFLFIPDNLTVVSKRFVGPEVAPLGFGFNIEDWYVPPDRQRYKR